MTGDGPAMGTVQYILDQLVYLYPTVNSTSNERGMKSGQRGHPNWLVLQGLKDEEIYIRRSRNKKVDKMVRQVQRTPSWEIRLLGSNTYILYRITILCSVTQPTQCVDQRGTEVRAPRRDFRGKINIPIVNNIASVPGFFPRFLLIECFLLIQMRTVA